MSNAAPRKVCQACGKDVTAEKRVKDSHNRYFCMPCNEAAIKRAHAAPAAAAVAVPAPAASDDGEYDLAPAEEVKSPPKSSPRPAAKAPQRDESKPSARTPALPKFCPNCEAPVLPNRKICIKCNRDLTRMDKLIAMKAEAAKGPSREEVVANWISRGIRAVVILVCIGVVIFLALGLKTMFSSNGPFDDFPTKKTQVVSDFLTHVARGEYEKAFYLVSFRERTTNNENEIENYKRLFAKMHDELAKKHGEGWISRVKIEPIGDPNEPGEDSVFLVKIDNDTYHAVTQVQISLDQSVANRASRQQPTYLENGKNHFGMVEIWEYPLKTRHSDIPEFKRD